MLYSDKFLQINCYESINIRYILSIKADEDIGEKGGIIITLIDGSTREIDYLDIYADNTFSYDEVYDEFINQHRIQPDLSQITHMLYTKQFKENKEK